MTRARPRQFRVRFRGHAVAPLPRPPTPPRRTRLPWPWPPRPRRPARLGARMRRGAGGRGAKFDWIDDKTAGWSRAKNIRDSPVQLLYNFT